MKIAFYAPMKPPDNPVPSGDRRMARLLMQALQRAGHEVALASRLRTWTRAGTAETAWPEMLRQAAGEVTRLLHQWKGHPEAPQAWFTYHLYHKAPDLIGPAVASALDIPYFTAEASRAAKQADGPWSAGFEACDRALRQAARVFAITKADRPGLEVVVPKDRLIDLPPFLDPVPFSKAAETRKEQRARWYQGQGPHLLTVAMMRDGDKDRSYQVLAEAMHRLRDRPWHLTIAGEGPRRDQVLERFPSDRVTAIGLMPPEDLATLYVGADIFVWPAVNEAYGLALLEAQAAGLPAVVGQTGGVPDIVTHGVTGRLPPIGNVEAFAAEVAHLLQHPDKRLAMGEAARTKVARLHSLEAASQLLNRHLQDLVA